MDGEHPGGGSRALAGLVDDLGSILISDLQFYFQADLGKTVSGEGFSPRRILAFVEGMPPASRTFAALGDDARTEGWDTQAYLLAGLVDAVRENTFVTAQIQSKKKLKRPDPIDVPGNKKKKSDGQVNLFAQMAAAQWEAAQRG